MGESSRPARAELGAHHAHREFLMALDPITAGLDLAKTVVQTIWPDKTEQEKAQLADQEAALVLNEELIRIDEQRTTGTVGTKISTNSNYQMR